MPTYCYERPDGAIVELEFPLGKAPEKIICRDGSRADRNIVAEQSGGNSCPGAAWRNFVSVASGIHPNQVAEARKRFPNHIYDNEGNMRFTSLHHRRCCMRDIGMHDKGDFLA